VPAGILTGFASPGKIILISDSEPLLDPQPQQPE
jgi:hypothetical protein